MSEWLDLVKKGVTAVSGLLAFVGAIYGGLAAIWLVMEEPDAFALVVSGAFIAAAIYLREAPKTYNLQMSHPDTDRVLSAVCDLIEQMKKRGN